MFYLKDEFPQFVQITPAIFLNLISNSRKLSFTNIAFIGSEKHAIRFDVSGQIKGSFICITNKFLNDQNLGIFIEAMNILLGHTVSEIEEKKGLMVEISHPELEHFEVLKNFPFVTELGYNLLINGEIIPCNIYYHFESIHNQINRIPKIKKMEDTPHA